MAGCLDSTESDDDEFEVVGHNATKEDELDVPSFDVDRLSACESAKDADWLYLDTEDEVSIPTSESEELPEPDEPQEAEEQPADAEEALEAECEAKAEEDEELPEPDEPQEEEEEQPADAEEASESECEAKAGEAEAQQLADLPAAELLAGAPLYLGGHTLAECEGFRRDITEQWAAAWEGFLGVTGAFCMGRILVLPSEAGSHASATAVARALVVNNGTTAWPTATTLRIVAGDPYGFDAMYVGPVAPGQAADLAIDVALPTDSEHGWGCRSAWVLTDGYGQPFGPLLVLEVMWA